MSCPYVYDGSPAEIVDRCCRRCARVSAETRIDRVHGRRRTVFDRTGYAVSTTQQVYIASGMFYLSYYYELIAAMIF